MGKAAEARALRKEAEATLRLQKHGRSDEALARVDELAAKHPDSGLVLHLAGRLHHLAANRALRASEKTAMASHLISAHEFLAEAKRLVPNCIEIATILARVLFEGLKHDEAESEARRAIGITFPVDPAENNVAYGLDGRENTTREQRVENARSLARFCFRQIASWVSENVVPDAVREVLDISKREGAAKALKRAKVLAERYTYSPRAQCFHGYMNLKFARGLDANIDKRLFLDRIRVDMNKAANRFDSSASLVLAMFRAKLCFILGLYDAAEMECRRAIGMESTLDPGDEDVPPGSVNGEEYDDRVSSICRELEGLLKKLLLVAKDYWCSMTSEKQDEFLSVRLDTLHEYYDEVYEDDHGAARTISDALSFVKKNRSWRFWICPICVGKKLPDADSLFRHMYNKHPTAKVLSKLQSVLDPKLSGGDTSESDYSLDEITVCQDSDEHYTFHFKKTDYMFECLFLLPSSGIETQSFPEIREDKCTKGNEILEKIKQKLNNLPADRSSTEFDKVRPEIQDLFHNFLEISVLDYREVILPLAKSFLWSKLIKCMSEDANIASKRIGDADIDAIFPDVADAPGSNTTVEHGSKPSHANKTDHKSGDDQQIKNLKPSFSDDTSKKDEEHKKSEVHVEDDNSGVMVNVRPSDPPIEMVDGKAYAIPENDSCAMVTEKPSDLPIEMIEDGNKLDAAPENVEAYLNHDSLKGTSLPSSSDQDYITGNTASHLLGTSAQSAEEMASISSYQKSVDVLKKNNADEDLFFLNVIVQSLWNLRRFRNEFLRRPPACFNLMHEGPCITEQLYEIFTACEKNEHYRMTLLLTDVKTTLCKIVDDSNIFQKLQVGRNFASEIMAMILEGLHKSETYRHFASNGKIERVVIDPTSCIGFICRAHDLFGIKLKQLMSCSCGEWFGEEYTSIFHELDASSPQSTKIESFAQIPVLMDRLSDFENKCKKCSGSVKHIDFCLSNRPHFCTIVLKNWLGGNESQATMSEALVGIASPLDITLLYKGVTLPYEGVCSATKYNLATVICYVEERYVCFAHDQDKWLIYDTTTVKTAGSWEELLELHRETNLRPKVLFFEVIK